MSWFASCDIWISYRSVVCSKSSLSHAASSPPGLCLSTVHNIIFAVSLTLQLRPRDQAQTYIKYLWKIRCTFKTGVQSINKRCFGALFNAVLIKYPFYMWNIFSQWQSIEWWAVPLHLPWEGVSTEVSDLQGPAELDALGDLWNVCRRQEEVGETGVSTADTQT